MLSELFKLLMKECGLTQKALAEVMGVPLQRVKHLAAGNVQKLTREETEALIVKLHVRADWLATGEGPMLQSPKELEFNRRLGAVRIASEKAGGAQLNREQSRLLQEILYFAEVEDYAGLIGLLPSLSPDEQMLLDRYRASPQPLRDAALRVLLGGEPGGQVQHVTGNRGQVTQSGKIINKGKGKA